MFRVPRRTFTCFHLKYLPSDLSTVSASGFRGFKSTVLEVKLALQFLNNKSNTFANDHWKFVVPSGVPSEISDKNLIYWCIFRYCIFFMLRCLLVLCLCLSKLHCIHFGSWDANKEWTVDMPKDEEIEAICLGQGWAACATTALLVRVFTVGGVQKEIFSLPGPVVSMAGHGEQLMVVYHRGSFLPFVYIFFLNWGYQSLPLADFTHWICL